MYFFLYPTVVFNVDFFLKPLIFFLFMCLCIFVYMQVKKILLLLTCHVIFLTCHVHSSVCRMLVLVSHWTDLNRHLEGSFLRTRFDPRRSFNFIPKYLFPPVASTTDSKVPVLTDSVLIFAFLILACRILLFATHGENIWCTPAS